MSVVFQRPPTAQEAILVELRRFIVTGELRPGQKIVQDSLAAQLGVSRVPLREALKILEGEGQVTYSAHRGYFVTELSLSDLVEVYRIREILEAEAVTVAVPQMTPEDTDRLEEAERDVQAAADIGDVIAMTSANRRLHFTLIDACALPRLVWLIRLLWDATEVYRSVYYNEEHNREVVAAEHRALVAAVRAGDAAAAVLVLSEHRAHAVAALRPVMEQAGDGEPTRLSRRRSTRSAPDRVELGIEE
jgi:DNA-binding GntR family transcriptional regulator